MRTGTLVGYLRTSNLRRGIVVIDLTAALRTLRLYYGRYGRFRPHHSTYDCITAGADRITPLTTALRLEPTASHHLQLHYGRSRPHHLIIDQVIGGNRRLWKETTASEGS